ncbi:MAG TPA: DUF4190 domain-containing protein [Pyrinomonadaceae bacterium]|nr:DUF4190 domain-containing protein [Pyrinomonadaceae bacterium]
MKRCPSCQRTYPSDAPDYCSNDGMRLVDEEAAEFDPEKTVMASGQRPGAQTPTSSAPEPPPMSSPPPPQPQDFQAPTEGAGVQPAATWQPPEEQQAQQQQQWPAQGAQPGQPGWSPAPAPAQNWGGAPYQQPAPGNAPYAATPYVPAVGGRSRALAIAALVTGACAVTIMSLLVVRGRDFVFTLMLIMAILGIGLGVAALIIALQRPRRFGGIPLAIAGLATGTAALVYYFTL